MACRGKLLDLDIAARAIFLAGALIALSACATTDEVAAPSATRAADALRNEPAPSAVVLDEGATGGPVLPKAEIFSGDDSFVGSAPKRRKGGREGDVILDFAEAD